LPVGGGPVNPPRRAAPERVNVHSSLDGREVHETVTVISRAFAPG
jgi:hypothetical protein